MSDQSWLRITRSKIIFCLIYVRFTLTIRCPQSDLDLPALSAVVLLGVHSAGLEWDHENMDVLDSCEAACKLRLKLIPDSNISMI